MKHSANCFCSNCCLKQNLFILFFLFYVKNDELNFLQNQLLEISLEIQSNVGEIIIIFQFHFFCQNVTKKIDS